MNSSTETSLQVAFSSNEERTTGIGCGIRMRTTGEYAFVAGIISDENCTAHQPSQVSREQLILQLASIKACTRCTLLAR